MNTALIILVVALTVTAIITDLKYRRIPNALTFSAALLGLLLHGLTGGLSGALFSLEGLAVGLAFLALPFLFGGVGAGDVKLLGALGALAGPQFVFWVFMVSGLVGGIIGLTILLRQRRLLATLKGFMFLQLPGLESGSAGSLPYAVPFAVGVVFAILMGLLR